MTDDTFPIKITTLPKDIKLPQGVLGFMFNGGDPMDVKNYAFLVDEPHPNPYNALQTQPAANSMRSDAYLKQ